MLYLSVEIDTLTSAKGMLRVEFRLIACPAEKFSIVTGFAATPEYAKGKTKD
jgi:hypothetical protein